MRERESRRRAARARKARRGGAMAGEERAEEDGEAWRGLGREIGEIFHGHMDIGGLGPGRAGLGPTAGWILGWAERANSLETLFQWPEFNFHNILQQMKTPNLQTF